MHVRWVVALWAAALLVPFAASQAPIQENATASQPQSSSSAKAGKQKYSHANDFLIRGTVFTDKAISFPGVQLHIRRSSDRKFRWEDRTNSRGEFAIRVPQGTQYEMVVHTKGFADQTRTIDARNGSGENNVVFRMEPAKRGKQ
ncbi:MAG TPA: carboxypeptidase-like regulatory domain-containing protein [Candidatus Acidoferrum sp.]|nr:carboxypeptidase-like regulatory domain-containing protein [Candidatus Acidoferrum sp.]